MGNDSYVPILNKYPLKLISLRNSIHKPSKSAVNDDIYQMMRLKIKLLHLSTFIATTYREHKSEDR